MVELKQLWLRRNESVLYSGTTGQPLKRFQGFKVLLNRSKQKQNSDPRNRFTSNTGTAPLTDHHGWNGEVFPCPVG